jgi:chromosome segregation ATPase
VYESGYGTNCGILADEPGLLLTASEAAAELVEDTNAQIALYKDEVKKLRSENESLKDAVEVLKEQKKDLEKTIDKHETTIEERTIECNRWEGMYNKASEKCDELRKKNDELTAWYEEVNKTASEAADANDELKAKVAELRTRNAELEALLKEVTATRDEAIKQNDDLKSDLEDARHVNEYAVETARSKEKLIGEQQELMKKYGIVIDILIDKITALKKGESDG